MSNTINGIGIPQPPSPPSFRLGEPAESASSNPPDFQRLLLGSLNQVDALQQSAQTAVQRSLSGDEITQVEVLSSMKQADLALRLMLQIRNKIFDAYDEIKQVRM